MLQIVLARHWGHRGCSGASKPGAAPLRVQLCFSTPLFTRLSVQSGRRRDRWEPGRKAKETPCWPRTLRWRSASGRLKAAPGPTHGVRRNAVSR